MTDVKANFPSMYQNSLNCNLCDLEKVQTVQHLLCCPQIIRNCIILQNNMDVTFKDIFSEGEKQIRAVQILKAVFESKEMIEDEEESEGF